MDLLITSDLTIKNGLRGSGFMPCFSTRDFVGGSSLVIRAHLGTF